MNIVVTGGAGFIGSHVAERLLGGGHSVAILDDLNDYYPAALKRNNLQEVASRGPIKFFECDICDAQRMVEIFQCVQPEMVVHLAARAGVRPSLQQPSLYTAVNVGGTVNLLEASRLCGVRKFLLASSSSVYGTTTPVPFSEDDCCNRPISPYAATKLAAEELCYTYSHLYGIEVACLRFFTVYGPRQRPDLAIRKFTELIHRGHPISLFGDGSSARDYTYIDDIVDGLVAALSYSCCYEVINLGNSHPVTLHNIVQIIEAALGRKVQIRRQPEQPGDVSITYADIAKARRLLGYDPQVAIGDGIRRFIAWYLQRICETV